MATPTLKEVQALLESSAYNPSIVPQLEAYVKGEAAGTVPYCFDANRTLTKLYQFFPHLANQSITALILLLALLEFPNTDLLALSSLVPEKVQAQEPSASILRCAELLDSCQFSEFWTVYGSVEGDEALMALVKSSTNKLYESIVNVLALTYRTAPLSIVLSALNMTSADGISKFSKVERVDGDTVVFVATPDNTKRDRVFQDGVNFSAISSMMAKAAMTRE